MKKDQELFIAQQVAELRGIVVKGFEGVHQRQDITNGRISKAETRLESLENKESFSKGEQKGIATFWKILITILGIWIAYLTYLATLAK